MSATLALDLGTTTGWALWLPHSVLSGSWRLASPKELRLQQRHGTQRTGDLRVLRLWQLLNHTLAQHPITTLLFEDVPFLSSQAQSQLWASLRTTVWLAGASLRVRCLPANSLKKFATGHGGASKPDMIAAAQRLPPPFGRTPKDDNEADALLLLWWWACSSQSNPVPAQP